MKNSLFTRSFGTVLLGTLALSVGNAAATAQSFPPTEATPEVSPAIAEVQYTEDLDNYGELLNQVTSINQLRDVSPADWSYEALRNLVDNYGCIVGYPDRTYRGNRPLSRNEFAAGLSACLTQLEKRMMASKQQLDALQPARENAVLPGDTLNNVFTRAFYNSTGRYYDITSVSGQANLIFGWRSWPGSYFDNMIAEDAAVVEAVYHDALRQQTQGAPVSTPDLASPYSESLRQNPDYIRLGNPPLPPTRSSATSTPAYGYQGY